MGSGVTSRGPPVARSPPRMPRRQTEPAPAGKPQPSLRERFGALRNLPPFLNLIWQTSPSLTVGDAALRLVRALLPVATLYVGKLIIDEVIRAGRAPAMRRRRCGRGWRAAGSIDSPGCWSRWSSASPCSPTSLGRVVSLLDSLLSEQFTNATSVRLMEHAATLDLEDFEDSELQDRLDRARRQTIGRMIADDPALRPGAGHGDHRQLRRRAGGLRAVADRCCWHPGAGPGLPRRGALQRRRATRSTTRGRRSGASSTTCARPAPASRPRRK